jgi:hypothetical protein
MDMLRPALALALLLPIAARAVEPLSTQEVKGEADRLRKPDVEVVVARVRAVHDGKPPHVELQVEEVLKGPIEPHVTLDAIWQKGPSKTSDVPASGELVLVMGKRVGKTWKVDPICRWPFSVPKRAWILLTVRGT